VVEYNCKYILKLQKTNSHLSSQIHDIVIAHVLVELHRGTFFLSGSKTDSSCYYKLAGFFLQVNDTGL